MRYLLKKHKLIKGVLSFLLICTWLLSGYPTFNVPGWGKFPPKINEANAAACSTITLATGTDPGAATIAPGSGIADRGAFTLTGNGTNCAAVTTMTVTLAASGTPYVGLAEASITSSDGATTYFSAVSSFASNTVVFSGGTSIVATTSTTTFKIRITPLAHTSMPAVPGANYAINPYISAWASGETEAGSDSNANTTTIDNTSPANVTSATATAATEQVNLGWTNPGDADVTTGGTIVVLRGTSAVSDTPVEGTTYSVGNTIGSAYVACVVTGSPPATSCSDTGLTAGTPYYYKIFAQDSRGNYSQTGTVPTGSPATPKGTTTLSTSSDPGVATVAPGSGIRSAGQFTYTTSTGSDTITALTLTLGGSPAGSYAAIDSVSIRDTSCAGTLYFSAVAPSSDSVSFSGGTTLSVSTGGNTYLVCVTPKNHSLASGTYSVSPYVSSTWTSGNSNTKAGTDTNSNALTIDNTAPNGATVVSGSAGTGAITINWTTSNSSDFDTTNGSVVYRWTASSAGAETPTDGVTPSTGDTNGTATVACVISSSSSTALSKIDGTGGSAGCTTSALTTSQDYTYKAFQRDQYGNYDAGVSIGTFAPTAASATYVQNHFRWYVDSDNENVTDPWSAALDLAEDTAITVIPTANDAPSTTQELRLRTNITVNTATITGDTKYFKLQFRTGTDSDCSAGSWTDVGSSQAFDYASSTVADDTTLTVAKLTGSDRLETYSKVKPANTPTGTSATGEDIEFDFHIIGSGSASNTRYLFRVVETTSDGSGTTDLSSWTNCPALTTEPFSGDLLRHGNFFSSGSEQGFYWVN